MYIKYNAFEIAGYEQLTNANKCLLTYYIVVRKMCYRSFRTRHTVSLNKQDIYDEKSNKKCKLSVSFRATNTSYTEITDSSCSVILFT